ncbi:MAG: hypothetical protein ABC596_06405 [Candidatus Methanosuratincola petrocarbonis]
MKAGSSISAFWNGLIEISNIEIAFIATRKIAKSIAEEITVDEKKIITYIKKIKMPEIVPLFSKLVISSKWQITSGMHKPAATPPRIEYTISPNVPSNLKNIEAANKIPSRFQAK